MSGRDHLSNSAAREAYDKAGRIASGEDQWPFHDWGPPAQMLGDTHHPEHAPGTMPAYGASDETRTPATHYAAAVDPWPSAPTAQVVSTSGPVGYEYHTVTLTPSRRLDHEWWVDLADIEFDETNAGRLLESLGVPPGMAAELLREAQALAERIERGAVDHRDPGVADDVRAAIRDGQSVELSADGTRIIGRPAPLDLLNIGATPGLRIDCDRRGRVRVTPVAPAAEYDRGNPLYIVAENHHDANVEARDRGLRPDQWRYIHGLRLVIGRPPARYAVHAIAGRRFSRDQRAALAHMVQHGWEQV